MVPLTAGWACEHMYPLSSHCLVSTSTQFLWLHSVGWGRLTHQAVVDCPQGLQADQLQGSHDALRLSAFCDTCRSPKTPKKRVSMVDLSKTGARNGGNLGQRQNTLNRFTSVRWKRAWCGRVMHAACVTMLMLQVMLAESKCCSCPVQLQLPFQSCGSPH